MGAAGDTARVLAIDLPGIGESAGAVDRGSKRLIARAVHELVRTLGLTDFTLVGHDAGGMVAYSYLRQYSDVGRVVIMNTVIPGVDPWSEVLRNPYIWHFGLHAVPDLPEILVRGVRPSTSATSTTCCRRRQRKSPRSRAPRTPPPTVRMPP
jgi:pimeloyl-ACP methyl ester carboxylesterase